MKWFSICKKTGREMVRDRTALFFSLLFPAIFILIFGFAFGSFTGGNNTYTIAVINLDEGVEINNATLNHGEMFISVLKEMHYLDSKGRDTSTPIFKVRTDLDTGEAQDLVENQDLVAYIIIPGNFSEAVSSEAERFVSNALSARIRDMLSEAGNDPNATAAILANIADGTGGFPGFDDNIAANVILKGDPGDSSYFSASGIIKGVLQGYVKEIGKITLEESQKDLSFEVDPSSQDPYVLIEDRAMEVSEFTVFDYQVPGIMVFGLLMSAMGVSISLAREESRGTLTRLKLTKMNSFDMLFGYTVPYAVLACVQIMILLGVALLMGYHYDPAANLGLALFIAVWGCLATVALGLILASLVKNEDQAGYISPAVAVPLTFLTGSFFSLPTITFTDDFLGTGRPFELFDWLPWTQCNRALTKTLTYAASPGDVLGEIVIMATLTAILFGVGVVLYHRKRLRAI